MFMERTQAPREEPIYGRKVFGFAPKGASRSQFGLVFYKHFAATRFLRQPPDFSWVAGATYLTITVLTVWTGQRNR